MRQTEELFRGKFTCSRCTKSFSGVHSINQYPDRRIEALCWPCVEAAEKTGEKVREHTVAHPTGIHAEWRMVAKVRLHKLNDDHDRRGVIVTLTMKDIQNGELAVGEAVTIAQFLMFFGGQYGIHKLGADGEQNHVWINVRSWPGQSPVQVTIDHKYIGEDEIEAIRDSARLLAKRWGWELEDDTISPLEKLARL